MQLHQFFLRAIRLHLASRCSALDNTLAAAVAIAILRPAYRTRTGHLALRLVIHGKPFQHQISAGKKTEF